MNELCLLRLRLARTPRVGPRTARLLEETVGLAALLRSDRAELVARGVPARLAAVLADPARREEAARELAEHRARGRELRYLGGPGYPPLLAGIHDPPQVLAVQGALDPARPHLAVVGARRATPRGRELAHELALELAAAGVTIVSGLARGIDAAAHEGALAGGGHTLAVLGSGHEHIYPAAHVGLARRIAQAGAILSEQPPRALPRRHSFPQRNRVVAGLSWGVLVVEAGPRSGALITADLALQEGRELFAVPGSPREPLARGTNGLIRDGAHLVEHAGDVLDVLCGVRAHGSPERGEERDVRTGAT